MKKVNQRLLILLALLCLLSCNRKPENIFEAIFNKYYTSVKLLHGKDQLPFECCIWLHFSISPEELDKLVFTYNFELINSEELDYKWERVLHPDVNWWNPRKFGQDAFYYEKKSADLRNQEGMFVNLEKTEVYYVNWYN